MAILTDHQFGIGVESTYGTAVTPTRFYEILESTKFQSDPMPLQGVGLRVGVPGGVNMAARRIPGIGKSTGSVALEVKSRGLGLLLNAACGTSTSTVVAGALFQQVHTPTTVNPFLPSLTAQQGIVNNVGTANPNTYAGCTVSQFTLACPEGGLATLNLDFDGEPVDTATALAAPSYPVGDSLFSYVSGSVKLGTTAFVAPTNVALASGGGAITGNVRSWELTSSNNVDDGRWVIGGRNQPTLGKRSHTLKFEYEYSDNVARDALLNQTTLSFIAELTTPEIITAGNPATLQVAIPAIKINTGSLPEATLGQTVKVSVDAEILWNGTNQPFYITMRTADTAL